MAREYKNSRFAGEMLVAAELSRLGYEVMLGNIGSHNTKHFDMTAVCPVTGHAASVSVKSLKTPNNFIVDPEKILSDSIYVFVITRSAGQLATFYVLRGSILLKNEALFFGKYGRKYLPVHGRGIAYKTLMPYTDKWSVLDEVPVSSDRTKKRRARPTS